MSAWVYRFGSDTFGRIEVEKTDTKSKPWLARLFGKSEGSKEFEPFKHDDGEHVTCRGSSEPNASFHERAASAASGP